MSVPFTTVSGSEWQSVDFVNELLLAFSERATVTDRDYDAYTGWPRPMPKDHIERGENIQEADFWAAIQYWMYIVMSSFINTGGGQLDKDPLTWSNFSYSYHRFRRYDGTTWSQGYMQRGDVIGAWIFEDIQAGLKLCIATSHDPNTRYAVDTERASSDGFNYCKEPRTCEVCRSDCINKWTGSWAGYKTENWGRNTVHGIVVAGNGGEGGDYLDYGCARIKSNLLITGINTSRPHKCSIYLANDGSSGPAYVWGHPISYNQGTPATDLDGSGFGSSDPVFYEITGYDTTSKRFFDTGKLSKSDCPAAKINLCPLPAGDPWFSKEGIAVELSRIGLEWNFTNM